MLYEVITDGIRVNCVCPGDVLTPMLHDDAEKRGMSWDDYAAGAADRSYNFV